MESGEKSVREDPAQPATEAATPADAPTFESVKNSGTSDQATAIDSLGFEPYVKAIAAFLVDKDTKPPLTLSIEGEWGSGKSSFMKQLQKEIERKEKDIKQKDINKVSKWRQKLKSLDHLIYQFGTFLTQNILKLNKEKEASKSQSRIITFNAWRHDKIDVLWATFALEFLRQISSPLPGEGLLEGFYDSQRKGCKLRRSRLNWTEKWCDIIRILALVQRHSLILG